MDHKSLPSPAVTAACLYLVALMVPALVITQYPLFGSGHHDQTFTGYACLMAGWFIEPAWLANPLLLFAAVSLWCKWATAAAIFSLTAVVLGISTLFMFGHDLRYPHVGFFLWIASMVMTAVAAFRHPARPRKVYSAPETQP